MDPLDSTTRQIWRVRTEAPRREGGEAGGREARRGPANGPGSPRERALEGLLRRVGAPARAAAEERPPPTDVGPPVWARPAEPEPPRPQRIGRVVRMDEGPGSALLAAEPVRAAGGLGEGVLRFEYEAAGLDPAREQEIVARYNEFVEGGVEALRGEGFAPPRTRAELERLVEAAAGLTWSNFESQPEVILLADGLGRSPPALDCDTSTYVMADLLAAFEVSCTGLSVPDHMVLCARLPSGDGGPLYVETLRVARAAGAPRSGEEGVEAGIYPTREAMEREYPVRFAERELGQRHAALYNARGSAFERRGDYARALQDYEQATRLDPSYADARYNKGCALANLGRHEEAIAAYREALDLNPLYARAHYNIGNALVRLARYEDALEAYGRALDLNPAYANAYANRGDILFRRGRYEEAFSDFDRAVALRPLDADAYYNRALAEQKLGRYEQAAADFGRSRTLAPPPRPPHLGRP